MPSSTQQDPKTFRFLVGVAIVTVAIWLVCPFAIRIFYRDWPDTPGVFGDQYGAVNALFTALTTAGLVYTIWDQQRTRREEKTEADAQKGLLAQQLAVAQKMHEIEASRLAAAAIPIFKVSGTGNSLYLHNFGGPVKIVDMHCYRPNAAREPEIVEVDTNIVAPSAPTPIRVYYSFDDGEEPHDLWVSFAQLLDNKLKRYRYAYTPHAERLVFLAEEPFGAVG